MATISELKHTLKILGAKGYSGKNKAELITMVEQLKGAPIQTSVKKVQTEVVGKMFEMEICRTYGIPYDGPYKYDGVTPLNLKDRLSKLPTLFPMCTHTAKKGAQYDYTAVSDPNLHLSAKTTKGDCKVAPQVIGQAKPQKFCAILGIPFTTVEALKEYIQTNIASILSVMVAHTFDCPNIYYNKKTSALKFVTLKASIDWSSVEFSWTQGWATWNNSSTLKIKTPTGDVALMEFQFHTKRSNMACRWCYENFLAVFKDHLEIVDL